MRKISMESIEAVLERKAFWNIESCVIMRLHDLRGKKIPEENELGRALRCCWSVEIQNGV